jgi:hypothetical protein
VKQTHEGVCALGEQVDYRQDEAEQAYLASCMEVASIVRGNPRRLDILDQFITGDIHKFKGGELAITFGNRYDAKKGGWVPDEKVFWHDHGSFVDKAGAMYKVRTDDEGVGQVYVSPVDERGDYIDCIHPYTYDCYIGPHSIDVRVDFVNGTHHAPPTNTITEQKLQAKDGLDVMVPRHQAGTIFDERRDSILLRKYGDGHIEGIIHDSESGEVSQLFSPNDIKAAIAMLDEMDAELEEFVASQDEA